ncbi:MAG: response regulator [Bacteroidota bacterium]
MKKILVIEDQLEVRENLVELLELSGYEALGGENGKVGVQLALQHQPDLILCDVMMPVLDGFGVLRILEKRAETADIPFIFLTAKTEKSDFRKGMNLGADDYITKPFDDIELLDAVEMRLKKSERIKTSIQQPEKALTTFINEAKGRAEFEQLSEDQEVRRFIKKENIFQEGELPRRLYYIQSGKVKLTKTNDDGKELILKLLDKGDFFGYLSLLKEEEYTESAVVMEEAHIVFIPKQDFLLLLYGNRDFSAHFIKLLTNNTLEQEEQLLSLAYSSIRKRVAESLIKLYQQRGEEIQILREDLANMVGTAKESVIRTLTDFRKEGLIEIESGIITILDVTKLMKMPN